MIFALFALAIAAVFFALSLILLNYGRYLGLRYLTLATIGQVARFGLFNARETEIADGSVGFGIDRVDRQGIGDRIEAARMPRLHGETDVFANAERRKKVGTLTHPFC